MRMMDLSLRLHEHWSIAMHPCASMSSCTVHACAGAHGGMPRTLLVCTCAGVDKEHVKSIDLVRHIAGASVRGADIFNKRSPALPSSSPSTCTSPAAAPSRIHLGTWMLASCLCTHG